MPPQWYNFIRAFNVLETELLSRCGSVRDVRVARVSGTVVGADAIPVCRVSTKARIRVAGTIRRDRGDLRKVAATCSLASLDLE